MTVFEKYLSLWIALAMAAGILLGNLAPSVIRTIAAAEVARVNLVVAVLIWAMVYPMMVGVDPRSLRDVAKQPRGLMITLVVNWAIKPFTMAALAVVFFNTLFAPWIAPEDASQYIAGLILLGAAPCTAMVFVWSHLTRGDGTYTLLQVSVNDLIMVVAFAPIVAFLLGRDRHRGPVVDTGPVGGAVHRAAACRGADHPVRALAHRRRSTGFRPV